MNNTKNNYKISVASLIMTTREMSRTSSGSGKKKVILSRTPRRRKRDDIPLLRLSPSGLLFLHGISIEV